MIRQAISPRLAIRMRLNMRAGGLRNGTDLCGGGGKCQSIATPARSRESGDQCRCAMWKGSAGFPEFTNEVQHLLAGVLPWDAGTINSRWKSAVRLPAYKPRAP